MRDFLFNYDNVCLRPKYSTIGSRFLADASTNFLGKKWKLPVIPANMQDVISWELAESLDQQNYFYIMHRFENANRSSSPIFRGMLGEEHPMANVSISLGVNDDSKRDYEYLLNHKLFPNIVTIDIAHGHHEKVEKMVSWLWGNKKERGSNDPYIIAGNVATAEGYKFLCSLGVNAVKVGIGGGSICSTRYKTGFHIPTAYSVWECSQLGLGVPIIADGGAVHYGDIVKALVLGADMVMSGRFFAECIDSPAKIQNGKKVYRGSTSFESKGHNNHIEGHTLEISEGCRYNERLIEIEQALQSAISYAGGKDLSAFNNVKWELIR